MIKITWSEFKNYVSTYSATLVLKIIENDDAYTILAIDANTVLQTILLKDLGSDQSDFETNYKTAWLALKNSVPPNSTLSLPPFGAKTMVINGVTKKLYARFTGIQSSVTSGTNTIDFVMPFAWAKIVGLEIIGGEKLDTADLKIYDTSGGIYSGYPNAMLNQFAYTMNIAPDFYQKIAQFDADIYQGMILRFTYNSVSAKTIGINFLINEVKS